MPVKHEISIYILNFYPYSTRNKNEKLLSLVTASVFFIGIYGHAMAALIVYTNEADYLAGLLMHGYDVISEGFESQFLSHQSLFFLGLACWAMDWQFSSVNNSFGFYSLRSHGGHHRGFFFLQENG